MLSDQLNIHFAMLITNCLLIFLALPYTVQCKFNLTHQKLLHMIRYDNKCQIRELIVALIKIKLL